MAPTIEFQALSKVSKVAAPGPLAPPGVSQNVSCVAGAELQAPSEETPGKNSWRMGQDLPSRTFAQSQHFATVYNTVISQTLNIRVQYTLMTHVPTNNYYHHSSTFCGRLCQWRSISHGPAALRRCQSTSNAWRRCLVVWHYAVAWP